MSDLLSLAAINVTVTLAIAAGLWRQISALTRTVSDVDRRVNDVDRRLAQLEGRIQGWQDTKAPSADDLATSYSRRRSVSIAALSAGSVTPSSLATWPHLTGRRLDGCEVGHFGQASTSRSSFTGRCLAAHLWQAVRSENTRPCIVKTRPARNHAW